MDNTWASPLYFRALEKGVDLSIQSATKYIGGHSDLMMGTVSASEKAWPQLKDTVFAAGPLRRPGRHEHGAARLAHAQRAPRPPSQVRARSGALARAAAGGAARAASRPARRARPRHLEARFHRRVRAVRGGAQAGAGEGRARLPQRADALRHGRVVGRLREPRDPVSTCTPYRSATNGRRAARACGFTSGSRTSAI